jgi:Dolichyl-phosphate-mannose-protein mannosyltransferase
MSEAVPEGIVRAPGAARRQRLISSIRLSSVSMVELGVLVGLTCGFLAFYWFAGFPIYNNATWLDPWYYTGLFVNFNFLYHSFPNTYYVSRLPWIAPGRVVFALFSPTTAYLVLHIAVGVGATMCLYLLLRRYFGRSVAVVGFAAAASSPVYYHTLYRDYVNSGVIAFLLAGMYFGLAMRAGRRQRLAMALAGFSLMAAFSTHFLAGLFAAAMVVPYFVLFRPRLLVVARDAIAFVFGAGILFVLCGVYASASGSGFNYLRPEINAYRSFHAASYKRSGVTWMLAEPRVLVPFFLVLVAGIVLAAGRGRLIRTEAGRACVAFGSYLVVVYTIVLVWELAGTGILIEWLDYYEIFYSITVLPFVGAASWLLVRGMSRGGRVAACAVASGCFAIVPLLLYRFGWHGFIGGRGAVLSLTIMVFGLLATAIVAFERPDRSGSRMAVVLLAAIGLALGVAYPVAASKDILGNMDYTASLNAVDTGVFKTGIEWVRWMRSHHYQDPHMVTWYDSRTTPNFAGIASLYFYGWVLQDTNMPHVAKVFRSTWFQRSPSEIVLLCRDRTCEGAPAALARAGYSLRRFAEREFVSGPITLWAEILAVTTPRLASGGG